MRDNLPNDCFLDPKGRRYLVKSLRGGEWHYDVELLADATVRATNLRDDDMARRAASLHKSVAEEVRKAQDRSWQPIMPMQYTATFHSQAGFSDRQTLQDTEFFEPIATDDGSGVSTVANMRQFRRHMNGDLDWPSAIAVVVDAWSAMVRNDYLNPIQRALLEVLYPGQMDLMDPFAAETLASLSAAEKKKLKELSEQKIKEVAGWRDGLPKMLPDSSFGTVR